MSTTQAGQIHSGMPSIRLHIVIISFGTRGDIQPHLEIAKVLGKQYGHRVRLVCGQMFKSLVEDEGIEFYCNGDVDPGELIRRRMLPLRELWKLIPVIRADFTQMSWRYWNACIGEPEHIQNGVCPEPFLADAIIAAPQPTVHSWIAARMSIPLHMVGTNPRSPSRYLPHAEDATAAKGESQLLNVISWFVFDFRFLHMMKSDFNHFRRKIGLQDFSSLWYWSHWNRLRVPFSNLWSPNVVPKPKDWGAHIKIAGYVFRQDNDYDPPADLQAFLASGEPPIYVGFGSAWVNNSKSVFNEILGAISATGVRAVIHQGTSEFASLGEHDDKICIIRDCPHDWLFPQMSAVVIHGGAGVTAMALKTGKPAVVCPVSGDMSFWGYRVWKTGCGPEPLPVEDITREKLANRINEALQPKYAAAASNMAAKIAAEEPGADAFARHAQQTFSIYEQDGRCDILPHKPAAWSCAGHGTRLQLSAIAAHILISEGILSVSQLTPLQLIKWPDMASPGDPFTGLFGGIFDIASLIFTAAKELVLNGQNCQYSAIGPAGSCSYGLIFFLLCILRVPARMLYFVSFGFYNLLDFICYQLDSCATPELLLSSHHVYSYLQMLLFLVYRPMEELNGVTIMSIQWGTKPAIRSLIAFVNFPIGLLALATRAMDGNLAYLTCRQRATDIVAEAKERHGRLEMQHLNESDPEAAMALVRAVLCSWSNRM